jgi:hypothetical protein
MFALSRTLSELATGTSYLPWSWVGIKRQDSGAGNRERTNGRRQLRASTVERTWRSSWVLHN